MSTTFRPCAPDQALLFPPSPRDWLPEGHLAFFIADTVAALDLRAVYAPYEGDGRRNQPFDLLPTLKKRRNLDAWSTAGGAAPVTGWPAGSSG